MNQGTLWAAMAGGADLTNGNGDYSTAMAVAPTDSNIIYVGSEDAAGTFPVEVTNGSQTSNNVTFTVTPQPDFKFGTITSSPTNATVSAGSSVTYTIPAVAVGKFLIFRHARVRLWSTS
ncbi:MAG: hypothetical protein WCA38_02820 [Candidatus Acidiferrales bacterium]